MTYRSPVAEIRFILDHVAPLAPVAATARFADVTPDTVEAVLTGAARLCDEVLAPLQRVGDSHPARLENGVVRVAPGFREAFAAIAEGGWVAVAASPEYGGMGLPQALNVAVGEMMCGACMSLQLNPLLTQGQIEALEHHGSEALKALYLPRLVSGRWSGTMNLTEPQAGSDVGALATRAERAGDGTYRITGQKIYITWGDSDVVENVCHLVLARLPDGGAGTRGISLFMVPKFLPDAEGNPGRPNALRVVGLERKLGLHAAPTCVMSYEGATGWLVGAEHRGMAAMFTMMNNARLAVGMQGVAIADAAFRKALAYATERVQQGVIADHPDVRRMLAEMKAETFAARAICLACAVALDMARATGTADWEARAALLTPIAKSYGSDVGCAVAQTGVQVHGGMGFVEDTGAAQYARDVRVTTIYEGTNGIQAADLVGRKLADGGEAAFRLLQEIEDEAEAARARLPDLAGAVWAAAEEQREATEAMLARPMPDRLAGSVAFQRAFALVLGAHFHLRAALAEGGTGPRTALARVFVRRILPRHAADLAEAAQGADDLFMLSPSDLAL